MNLRFCVVVLLLGLLQLLAFHAQAKSGGNDELKEAWKKRLESERFVFAENYSGLLTSLGRFNEPVKIHLIFDPKNKWKLQFAFVRDGKEVLTIDGHFQSAFVSIDNKLYFTNYPEVSSGCTVLAYDLSTGKKLWETDLHHEQPKGHSAYRNLVAIRVSDKGEIKNADAGDAIIVRGHESYCDYVEVLDRNTGESLAIKNYRVGFGSRPPTRGGFGGESKTKKTDGGKGGKQ